MNNSSKLLYSKFAPYYHSYYLKRNKYLRGVDSYIVSFLINNKIKNYLDIGSGDGVRAQKLANEINAKKIALMDNCLEMVQLSKKIKNTNVIYDDIVKYRNHKCSFEAITCLWNVFGHIDRVEMRQSALNNISSLLDRGGYVFIDVNNRYNFKNYGFKTLLNNLLKDIFKPSIKNGDIMFEIIMKRLKLHAKVHIFNPWELDCLIKKTDLKIIKKIYINYKTGTKDFFLGGQILYILKR